MKPEPLFDLLAEVEKEDPVDFSGLPFDADDLRRLACLNVSEMMEHWVDAPAAELPIALGNLYVGIKKRGTL